MESENNLNKPKITDFIKGKVSYDNYGQYLWVNLIDDDKFMLGKIRGWGDLISSFKNLSTDQLAEFQEQIGQFVADAINEKIEKLNNNINDKSKTLSNLDWKKFEPETMPNIRKTKDIWQLMHKYGFDGKPEVFKTFEKEIDCSYMLAELDKEAKQSQENPIINPFAKFNRYWKIRKRIKIKHNE
jgi:hypothetical protein